MGATAETTVDPTSSEGNHRDHLNQHPYPPPGRRDKRRHLAGRWRRHHSDFAGTKRGDRLHIQIIGQQDYSGAIRRAAALVEVPRHGVELDAAALRKLAADALAAADELDHHRS